MAAVAAVFTGEFRTPRSELAKQVLRQVVDAFAIAIGTRNFEVRGGVLHDYATRVLTFGERRFLEGLVKSNC